MHRARGIPMTPFAIPYLHRGIVWPPEKIAHLYLRENLSKRLGPKNVLALNANGPSAAARARRAENYLSSRETSGNFSIEFLVRNDDDDDDDATSPISPPLPSPLVTSFLFSPPQENIDKISLTF
ncbi:hypothetical protein PUN28_000238 [Cardiocondyla obscurior]|uniref:Uncharacterized protein n=1 Tax=Cardiocondyla obscurior TaxID=286306 RepID=A0AAW2GYC2_9HYME